MKNLIQQAKEKGFDKTGCEYGDLCEGWEQGEYLWLCLLQKWLRDEHDIHVRVYRNPLCSKNTYEYIWHYVNKSYFNDSPRFETYEQALIEGLTKGVELI